MINLSHEFPQYTEDMIFRWTMDKFWHHVDYLIPEDKKQKVSKEDAQKRINRSNSALNRLQVEQAAKQN